MKKIFFLLIGVTAFFSLQGVSYAQHFTATLNTAQEVPAPTVSTTPTGTGAFTLSVGPVSQLRFDITINDLSGPITAVHFHRAPVGQVGGIVRTITGAFRGNTAAGVWRSTDRDQPLTAELRQALLNGEIYANIFTESNPLGEIRGQFIPTLGFTARLDTRQEVPAPTVSTTPTGTASFTLQGTRAGGVEVVFDITVNDLSGPIQAAHFHRGVTGATGPVVHAITGAFNGNTASGVWRSTDDEPLTPDLLRALVNGEIYVNIHTANNPLGEIRGQLVPE